MSLIQGKDINSVADQISQVQLVKDAYQSNDDKQLSVRVKETLDELLNFAKLKHHLYEQGLRSFHIKIAPNTYYTWELG